MELVGLPDDFLSYEEFADLYPPSQRSSRIYGEKTIVEPPPLQIGYDLSVSDAVLGNLAYDLSVGDSMLSDTGVALLSLVPASLDFGETLLESGPE